MTQWKRRDRGLLDCHSFTQADEDAPDICIGFNGDFSYDERIVDLLLKEFNSSGYSTALNKPYANTLTPVKDKEYKSFMIVSWNFGHVEKRSPCRPAAGFRIPTK